MLIALDDARAAAVLARAYDELQTAAARFHEPTRQRYLNLLPWKREIVRLVEANPIGFVEPRQV